MQPARMPALFIGHGSPMNAIENNVFTKQWQAIGNQYIPKAILMVSAHWYTKGSHYMTNPAPRMIYDMYGFPKELYEVVYPAPGAPALAAKAGEALENAWPNAEWGFDHGGWSVLCHLYPKADIPVFQISVNAAAPMEEHFAMGKLLAPLREEGVMIIGSGNVVHNLSRLDWNNPGGYDWADEFDAYIKTAMEKRDFASAVNYKKAGQAAAYSFITPDHYAPLLYAAGAAGPKSALQVLCDARIMGALSMTSYLFTD